MKTSMYFRNLAFILILFVAFSCTNKNGKTVNQVKEYQVMAVKPQPTTLFKAYPTKIEGQQTVEIRPRIAGYIDKILVDEGAYVRKGQTLFLLNDNEIMANVRSAEAQVKIAEAEVSAGEINLKKTRPLVEKNIISKFDLESAEVALQAKEAQLAQAKANLENAKANLQYTVITSPTDGTIGNFPYRVGSLVSSAIAQPLTSISNTINMYAYFSMNEKEFFSLLKGLDGENVQKKLSHLPNVTLILADNSIYEHQGKIKTASGLVDQQTGAVNMRATFSNPEELLRSGSSGMIHIPQHINSALIIPQKATYELQGKYYVYVVGEGNKVRNTEVEVLVGNLKDSYVVTKGLKTGDQVVIEGIASLRNGTPIKPKLTDVKGLAENEPTENQLKN